MLSPLLQKLQETVDNPGLYRPLTAEEQAELFLTLFAPKPKLFEKPKVIKGIDGTTPVKDKDYLSKEKAEEIIATLASKTQQELEKVVAERLDELADGADGDDAVITDDLIEYIAEKAQAMIRLPDFPTLITMEPEAIRNALELLPDGEKLAQEAIEGLPERLQALEDRPIHAQVGGGGLSQSRVLQLIAENSSGADWTYYATTWSVEPTLNTSITGGDVYNYTLDGTTRYRFVPTVYDATEDAFYSTFSNPTLSGLIVTRG